MGLIKQGLRLLGTHAVMSLVQFIFMPSLFGIFEKNQIYQWFIGLVYIALFWLVVYADMSGRGLDDCKKDIYAHYKGFVVGLIASIPAFILYILAINYQPVPDGINWFSTALRVWLVPYTKIFVTLESSMPNIAIIPILSFSLVSGISYMDGTRKRKKILNAIEKAEALKTEKSKVNINL